MDDPGRTKTALAGKIIELYRLDKLYWDAYSNNRESTEKAWERFINQLVDRDIPDIRRRLTDIVKRGGSEPPPYDESIWNVCVPLASLEPSWVKRGITFGLDLGDDQFKSRGRGEPVPACTIYSIVAAQLLIEKYKLNPSNVDAFKKTICDAVKWNSLVGPEGTADFVFNLWKNAPRAIGQEGVVPSTPRADEIKKLAFVLDDVVIDEDAGLSEKREGDVLSELVNIDSIKEIIRWLCTKYSTPVGVIFTYLGSSSAIVYLPFDFQNKTHIVVFDSHGKIKTGRKYAVMFEVPLTFDGATQRYGPSPKAITQVAQFIHEKIAYGQTFRRGSTLGHESWVTEQAFSAFTVEWKQK